MCFIKLDLVPQDIDKFKWDIEYLNGYKSWNGWAEINDGCVTIIWASKQPEDFDLLIGIEKKISDGVSNYEYQDAV